MKMDSWASYKSKTDTWNWLLVIYSQAFIVSCKSFGFIDCSRYKFYKIMVGKYFEVRIHFNINAHTHTHTHGLILNKLEKTRAKREI